MTITRTGRDTEPEPLVAPEPEPEPQVAQVAQVAQAAPTHVRVKYSTKQVEIEKFSGAVPEGRLDAGAGAWIKSLQRQIRYGEIRDQTKWPDDIKVMLLESNLTGTARMWHQANYNEQDIVPYDQLKQALRNHFRCRLDRMDISAHLKRTSKLATETYLEYAQRLREIASAMNDGEEDTLTLEDALTTFVSNAWPQHRVALLGHVQPRSINPHRELEKAIEYLTRIAGHDGKRRTSADTAPRKPRAKRPERGDGEEAFKRERPPKAPRRDYSNTFCGKCKRSGHSTDYHDKWVARQGGIHHAKIATATGENSAAPHDDEAQPNYDASSSE